MEQIKSVLKSQPKPNFTLQTVIKAITRAIDAEDILVDCTCPDFIYRFAYWATKFGYKYGKPENRPAKITNPNDKLGAMCKHLTALLSNKKWLVKVASVINEFVKAYPNEVQEFLGLDDDEFIINDPKAKSILNKKRNLKKNTVLPKKDPEELEPVDPNEDSDQDENNKEFSNIEDNDEELELEDNKEKEELYD